MDTPRLLLCGFGPFPAAPRNPSTLAVEAVATSGWAPPGAEIDTLSLPVSWADAVPLVLAAARARLSQGVLVVGVSTSADAFRVETVGRNRASRSLPDHTGEVWHGSHIDPDGPGAVASTAPVGDILDSLVKAGVPARLSEDAGDYLCNFTLYSLIVREAAPAVGFLHVPQARECDPAASFDLADIHRAVRAAATGFAGALSPAADLRRTA